MYRIKLPNGTILEFDSLDSLTVDIHAGVVEAEALIFHQRANQWLPIHVHPAWKQALATPRKAPTAGAAAAGTGTPSKPPAAAKPVAPAPKPPITRIGAPPKPGAPRPVTAAKAPTAPAAKVVAAGSVSVDHLDEELELLGIDELALPGQDSAAVAVLARPAHDQAVAAPEPVAAPVTAPESARADEAELLELLPASAVPEPAPAPVPAPSMAIPAPAASAETLVPRSTLLIDPVEESTAIIEAPAATDSTSAAPSADVTTDLTSDFAEHAPAPTAMVEPAAAAPEHAEPLGETAAPEHAEQPNQPTTADLEPSAAAAIPVHTPDEHTSSATEADEVEASEPWQEAPARVPAARPNRMVWYAGGAVAAAGILVALALRTGDAGATKTPPTEDAKSANAGIPGAPLKPPAPALDLPAAESTTPSDEPALGRIDAPAEVSTATPSVPTAASASKESPKESPKEKTAKSVDAEPKKVAAAKAPVEEVVLAPVDLSAMTATEPISVKFDVAPNVLSGRYLAAQEAAWNDLMARLRVAGFDNLFAGARTAPTGAATARASVAAARAHIAQWRTRTSIIEKAYRDSTSALISAGAWNAAEQREWEGRARRPESGEAALQANAILSAADRLYGILAANSSAYDVVSDGLRFSDSGAQRQYWDARRTLIAAIGAAGSAEPKTPLAAILKAIGSSRPPEGLNAS